MLNKERVLDGNCSNKDTIPNPPPNEKNHASLYIAIIVFKKSKNISLFIIKSNIYIDKSIKEE